MVRQDAPSLSYHVIELALVVCDTCPYLYLVL